MDKVKQVLDKYFALILIKEKYMDDGENGGGEGVWIIFEDILRYANINKENVLGVLRIVKVDKSPEPNVICPKMLND